MEYTVIQAGSHERIIKEVNQFISAGWRPQGGVAITPQPKPIKARIVFAQAMIKDDYAT